MPYYYTEPSYCDCVEYDTYAICYSNHYPAGVIQNYAVKEKCPWYDCLCLWNDPYLVYVKPKYYPECANYSYCTIYTPEEYYGYYYDYSDEIAAGIIVGALGAAAGLMIADALLL